jgi:hypothetical protein
MIYTYVLKYEFLCSYFRQLSYKYLYKMQIICYEPG